MAIPDRAVYPTQSSPLRSQVTELLKRAAPASVEGEIMAVIVPDSNRLRGGAIAAEVFKSVEGRAYDTVVLVAPSHAGAFGRMNICRIDTYQTPLGPLTVNDRIRNELCDEDDDIFLDDRGHYHTEGVDVQLPFLQTVLEGFDIVPIVMGEESPEFCRELGHAIGEIMYNRRILVVASADILEASPEALERFREYFERADVSRLMSLLNSETVRLEGRGAVLVALIAALYRRANRVQLLSLEPPEGEAPGAFGAVISRR